MKKYLVLSALMLTIFASCKKTELQETETILPNESLTVRKDNIFPDGVLEFKSSESFKQFWSKIVNDAHYVNKVTKDFKTFRNILTFSLCIK